MREHRRKLVRSFIRNRTATIGTGMIIFFIFIALFAPLLAPHDPIEANADVGLNKPSLKFPLGTDKNGRDILSRIIYGSRISLQVGIIAVGLAIVIGSIFGLLSGYYGGWLDNLIMRLMDIMLALPSILLAIVVVAALGPNLFNAMIAVSVVSIPAYARILRASVLTIREQEYVLAARAIGANDLRILIRAILPNCLAPLIVQATLGMGIAILDLAGLSFLGLGARPPQPEWGAMLNENFMSWRVASWTVTAPTAAIWLVVLGFNFLGDGLRDIMDPQLLTKQGKK